MNCSNHHRTRASEYQYQSGRRDFLCARCLRKMWDALDATPHKEVSIAIAPPIRNAYRLFIVADHAQRSKTS